MHEFTELLALTCGAKTCTAAPLHRCTAVSRVGSHRSMRGCRQLQAVESNEAIKVFVESYQSQSCGLCKRCQVGISEKSRRQTDGNKALEFNRAVGRLGMKADPGQIDESLVRARRVSQVQGLVDHDFVLREQPHEAQHRNSAKPELAVNPAHPALCAVAAPVICSLTMRSVLPDCQRKPHIDVWKVTQNLGLEPFGTPAQNAQSFTKSNNPAFEKSSFAIGRLMSSVGNWLVAVPLLFDSTLVRRPLFTKLSTNADKLTPSKTALAFISRKSPFGKLIVVRTLTLQHFDAFVRRRSAKGSRVICSISFIPRASACPRTNSLQTPALLSLGESARNPR